MKKAVLNQARYAGADETNSANKAKTLVTRMINSLTTSKEKSAVEVATHVLQLPWTYESHEFTRINLNPVVTFMDFFNDPGSLLPSGETDWREPNQIPWSRPCKNEAAMTTFRKSGDNIVANDFILSYWHRSTQLLHLCLYDFATCVETRKFKSGKERADVAKRLCADKFLFEPKLCWEREGARLCHHPLRSSHYLKLVGTPGGNNADCKTRGTKRVAMVSMQSTVTGTEMDAKLFLCLYHPFEPDGEGKPKFVGLNLDMQHSVSTICSYRTALHDSLTKIAVETALDNNGGALRRLRRNHWEAKNSARCSQIKATNERTWDRERKKVGLVEEDIGMESAHDVFFEDWEQGGAEDVGLPKQTDWMSIAVQIVRGEQFAQGKHARNRVVMQNCMTSGWKFTSHGSFGGSGLDTGNNLQCLTSASAHWKMMKNPMGDRASTIRNMLPEWTDDLKQQNVQKRDALYCSTTEINETPEIRASKSHARNDLPTYLSTEDRTVKYSSTKGVAKMRLIQAAVIKDSKIEGKQLLCYKSWTDHIIDLLSKSEPAQKIGCLFGPGGAGKSHVINAIKTFVNQCCQPGMLVCIAMTANAANAIGGVTYHKICAADGRSDIVKSNLVEFSASTLTKLSNNLAACKLLLWDEISFGNASAVTELHRRMVAALRPADSRNPPPFGGASVLWCGDMLQLGPRGRALWSTDQDRSIALNNRKFRNTSGTSKDFEGLLLWRLAKDVVFLEKQYRQKGILKQICQQMRSGTPDKALLAALKTRVATKENKLLDWDGPFGDARTIVQHNDLREQINNTRMKEFSVMTNQRIIVCPAKDKIKMLNASQTSRRQLEKSLLLAQEADTNYLPSLLLLCVGAPYVIKKNVVGYDQMGIINGASCILERIITHKDEPPFDATLSGNSEPHFLQFLPTLIVRLRGKPRHAQLQDLLPQEIPLECSVTLPFLWPVKSNKHNAEARILRRQMPITMEWSRSTTQAQGGTFNPVTIHIGTSNCYHDVYVKLTRAVDLNNLVIIADFPLSLFEKQPSAARKLEIHRLKKLEYDYLKKYWANNQQFCREHGLSPPRPPKPLT
jgi:hypothetical protein